jgi:hypothetical protein
MADEQPAVPTQDVKAEGDNAPINVKVRALAPIISPVSPSAQNKPEGPRGLRDQHQLTFA